MSYLIQQKSTLIIVILYVCLMPKTFGQHQPKAQDTSVRAPLSIKIDGALKEWPNKNLNAYNGANRIYYVVSNDDQCLYLTVRGSGTAAGNKILKEGIKFTVSHSLEKTRKDKDPGNVSITYPGTPDARVVSVVMAPNLSIANFIKDPVKNKRQIDSLTALANTRVESISKEIKVKGIKEIKDSVLSVYNNVGIKAAIHFSEGEPIVELAIPLKYLDLSTDTPMPFSYNIKLAAPALTANFDINSIQKSGAPTQAVPPDDLYRMTDTDLWGEYILAKKK